MLGLKNKIKIMMVCSLICVSFEAGNGMKHATRVEKTYVLVTKPGTKEKDAAIGAGIGSGIGLLGGLVIGGIGVATGGTAFAIGVPLMMLMGGAGGALTGAAAGQSQSTTLQAVYHNVPKYPAWTWEACFAVSALGMVIIVIFLIMESRKRKERMRLQ